MMIVIMIMLMTTVYPSFHPINFAVPTYPLFSPIISQHQVPFIPFDNSTVPRAIYFLSQTPQHHVTYIPPSKFDCTVCHRFTPIDSTHHVPFIPFNNSTAPRVTYSLPYTSQYDIPFNTSHKFHSTTYPLFHPINSTVLCILCHI